MNSVNNLVVVILAAGEGTRMKSKLPKVLHPLGGTPMIRYVLDTALGLNSPRVMVVVGHQADEVQQEIKDYPVEFVLQPEQLGTGDAVKRVKQQLGDFEGNVLILNGDTPLLSQETLASLVHQHGRCPVTMLTTTLDDPTGYGRIIRDAYGDVRGIVEEKDASPAQKMVKEICSGIYCFESKVLFETLEEITPDNAQAEYYLTDVIGICRKKGIPIHTHSATDPVEVLGINDRIQLAQASRLIRERILTEWMLKGVTIVDPQSTYIDRRVTIGRDTTIYPHTIIEGECSIGEGCHIGPFARIRPESVIEAGARIGNFVEIKKSIIGRGSKINHLSYIGDATVGAGVNIGAGTITCNYDGQKKHQTVIEDGVFVGSGSQLVAPVRVGKHSYVGAGSTITQDVPPYSLALTRARETQKPNWVKRRKRGKKTS
jgi:bifunctional UDP-N-acetylglucosamine pyrophosphorylase/glucosamine-1-phosphate N-acetyltransferase